MQRSSGTPVNIAGSKKLEVVSKQATKVTPISTRLEWRIEQFEKLMKLFKNGNNLISKQFSCPQAPSVVWELHVYPNGKREEDTLNVSFFLRQVGLQRGEDPIMTEFQIYTLDGNDCRISICRDTKDFSNQQGRGKFQVQRDKMITALRTDGSLLLICEVEYLPPGSKMYVEQDDSSDSADEARPEVNLRDSLREMWQTELFSDCVIQVGTARFPAHRCILGQNSAVFRSMFSLKTTTEAQNGLILITDSRPEHVRAMLEYIYTGGLEKSMLDNHAQGILAISDKYAILPLKEHCERFLSGCLNGKNVTTLALIADMYYAGLLKKACARFIAQHHKSVIRSPEWRELREKRSLLASELLESVLDDGSIGFGLAGSSSDEGIAIEDSSLLFGGGNGSSSSASPATINSIISYSNSSPIGVSNGGISTPIGGGGAGSVYGGIGVASAGSAPLGGGGSAGAIHLFSSSMTSGTSSSISAAAPASNKSSLLLASTLSNCNTNNNSNKTTGTNSTQRISSSYSSTTSGALNRQHQPSGRGVSSRQQTASVPASCTPSSTAIIAGCRMVGSRDNYGEVVGACEQPALHQQQQQQKQPMSAASSSPSVSTTIFGVGTETSTTIANVAAGGNNNDSNKTEFGGLSSSCSSSSSSSKTSLASAPAVLMDDHHQSRASSPPQAVPPARKRLRRKVL